MLTLVICLVVVALSGAAVLHISLVDQSKRATPKRQRPRDRPAPPAPEPRREPAPPPPVIEAHRARSAGLLVLLLTFIGGVLAVVVAFVAVTAVRALRAALVG